MTDIWIAMLGVGAVTFLMRASFIVFTDPGRFPPLFRRSLAFVPPAVLAAIVAPGLFLREGALDLSMGNPRWIAGLAAILVAWRTKSVLATLLSGMAVLWLLQWSMG